MQKVAFAKVFDSAIFTGVGKPSFWRDGLIPSVVASGNVVTESADKTFYQTINEAMEKVEEDGYNVTGILGGINVKSKFRNMVDKNGQPLNTTEIGSLRREFVDNGAWDKTLATAVVGDFTQAVYAISILHVIKGICCRLIDRDCCTFRHRVNFLACPDL